mgnify:CR=1 FL=1
MEFLDTPNPNAKKIIISHDHENGIYINENLQLDRDVEILYQNPGVKNIFTGPNFLTIMKEEDANWDDIIEDLKDNT